SQGADSGYPERGFLGWSSSISTAEVRGTLVSSWCLTLSGGRLGMSVRGFLGLSSTSSTAELPGTLVSSWCLTLPGDWLGCLDGLPGIVEHQLGCGVAGCACVKLVLDTPRGLTRVSAWVDASYPGGHVGGVEVGHAGDEVDYAHVAGVQPPVLLRGVVAQQVQDPA